MVSSLKMNATTTISTDICFVRWNISPSILFSKILGTSSSISVFFYTWLFVLLCYQSWTFNYLCMAMTTSVFMIITSVLERWKDYHDHWPGNTRFCYKLYNMSDSGRIASFSINYIYISTKINEDEIKRKHG